MGGIERGKRPSTWVGVRGCGLGAGLGLDVGELWGSYTHLAVAVEGTEGECELAQPSGQGLGVGG